MFVYTFRATIMEHTKSLNKNLIWQVCVWPMYSFLSPTSQIADTEGNDVQVLSPVSGEDGKCIGVKQALVAIAVPHTSYGGKQALVAIAVPHTYGPQIIMCGVIMGSRPEWVAGQRPT